MKSGVLEQFWVENGRMVKIAISDLKIATGWLNFSKIAITSSKLTEASFCPKRSGKKSEIFSPTKIFVAVRNFYIRNFYGVAGQHL